MSYTEDFYAEDQYSLEQISSSFDRVWGEKRYSDGVVDIWAQRHRRGSLETVQFHPNSDGTYSPHGWGFIPSG